MYRTFLLVVSFLLVASFVLADEAAKTTTPAAKTSTPAKTDEKQKKPAFLRPASLYTSSLELKMTPKEIPITQKQEEIEVSAPAYPGLNMDLPDINDLLAVEKPIFGASPGRDPGYDKNGGMILSRFGYVKPSGQAASTESVAPHKN